MRPAAILVACALVALAYGRAVAQTMTRIGGPHVAAHVQIVPRSGRFWITSGHLSRDSVQLLFGSRTQITSNVVFRVERAGAVTYVCNAPVNGEPRPLDERGAPIPFRPFDEASESADTLALHWRDVDGFDITMRFIPDRDAWPFVSGGDMLVEFDYRLGSGAEEGTLGILMMLDLFNNDPANAGQEDRAEILSERSYHVPGEYPLLHTAPVPAWYLVGRFTDDAPRTRAFGLHRLVGATRAGQALTSPELVAFDRWASLRLVSWQPPTMGGQFFDATSVARWGGLRGAGVVRTAFGLNDSAGNSFSFAYARRLFVAMQTVPFVRVHPTLPPTPGEIHVDAWALAPRSVTGDERIYRLVVSHDGRQGVPPWLFQLTDSDIYAIADRRQPKRLRWTYRIVSPPTDSVVSFRLQTQERGQPWRNLDHGGEVIVRVLPYDAQPPADRIGPLLLRIDSSSAPEPSWTLRARDRGESGPQSGIERIELYSPGVDSLVNARGFVEPSPWIACDTATVTVRVSVIDSLRPADAIVAVVDCGGNRTLDTIRYRPAVGAAPDDPERTTALSGRIVPQPCGDCGLAYLELPRVVRGDARVVVMSIDGSVIATRDVSRGELLEQRVAVDATSLAAGFYVVELRGRGASVRAPMIIAR